MSHTTESLGAHARPLDEAVFLQNQLGPSSRKWDRSGRVVESLAHDQYRIKVAYILCMLCSAMVGCYLSSCVVALVYVAVFVSPQGFFIAVNKAYL